MGIIEFLKTMSIRNKIKVISVFPLIFIIFSIFAIKSKKPNGSAFFEFVKSIITFLPFFIVMLLSFFIQFIKISLVLKLSKPNFRGA